MELTDSPAGQHSGGIFNYFQGATIHNLVINGNMTKSGPDQFNDYKGAKEKNITLNALQISQALERCSNLIWGNAAYSVVFCVCRDAFYAGNNASSFERVLYDCGVELPEGTINAALNRNPWMKMPIDKWEGMKAMDRVLKLRDGFLQAMENIIISRKVTA